MQYGNLFLQIAHNIIPMSLNRTMQYGNRWKDIQILKSLNSLNRTMQYGNYNNRCILQTNIHEFKSYYVVWKLNEAVKILGHSIV